PGPLLAVAFASQARELFGRVQRMVAASGISGAADLLEVPLVGRAIRWSGAGAPVGAGQGRTWLITRGQRPSAGAGAAARALAGGARNALVGLAVTLFLLFFFLRDGDRMVATTVRLIPLPPERRDHLMDHIGAVVRAVVFGSLLTALVQGVLVAVGFKMVGL